MTGLRQRRIARIANLAAIPSGTILYTAKARTTADAPAKIRRISIYTKDWWTTTMVWILALYLSQDDTTAAAPAAANGSALLEMVHNSGPVAFTVLVILLIASIFSWTIMISKWSRFGRARTQSLRFVRAFRKSTRLSEIATVAEQFRPSPLVAVFSEIHDEYQRQNNGRGMPRNPVALERAAQTAASEALTAMESRMTWLATIAAIAPFIGLFGTVMGIIDAFHGLGTAGAATLRAVAPGISEALITTAAGLVVAIPAVVGYNQLTARLREFAARMDDFGRELLNAIENAAMMTPPPTPPQPEEARRRTF
jgi:biopolymer transport protein TolQ